MASVRTASAAAAFVLLAAGAAAGQERLHFTYLWHLEQPIYWPDQRAAGSDRYENAWESILRRDAGAAHPSNNLREIFGLADRVAAYQHRCRDSIDAIRGSAEAGAQISYSGGLIENVRSLGNAGQLGYTGSWYAGLREARGWATVGQGKPRADIVLFSHHHALLPLLEESTVRKEIAVYKAAYAEAWGTAAPMSRGFFPSEMAFSTRLVRPLAQEGVAWSFVSAEKVSRACADFPVVFGSGGVNTDPPNRADQVNPAQGGPGAYYRVQISRGCAPAEAYPFALTPRRVRSIDPNSNPASPVVHEIIAVPCSQSLGWKDGYAPLGLSDFTLLDARNDPARPMLAVLAHDGDNAWGGGFSYYMEATPNLVSAAAGAGFVATTVEEYLADHPVPAGDVVHVEDGAWVNADGDFGAPSFLNWNWPLVDSQGRVDIAGGWAEDARNWAVITAAQNFVDTAEQMTLAGGGVVSAARIYNPDAAGGANAAERAWHYFLGALNSGYMYYGTAEDFEVKPTIACNEALEHAQAAIAAAQATGRTDQTGPTIWLPQRWPWNPGSINFGPAHGYQQRPDGGDFWVYTFVHDVSGMGPAGVTLKYRVDADGVNPLASWQNETYAGGAEVGAWQSIPMTARPGGFPAGNFFNSPTINFFEMPQAIAGQFHAQITGVRSSLLDYYVEAVDSLGNVRRSPIQHVWVGDGSGAGPGGGSVVEISPSPAVAGQSVQVSYNSSGRPLAAAASVRAHVGFNSWQTVVAPDVALAWNAAAGRWTGSVAVPQSASQIDFAFTDGAGVWDNNGGADWHFPVTGTQVQTGSCCTGAACAVTTQAGCAPGSTWTSAGSCSPNPCSAPPPNFVMDGVLDAGTALIAQNNGMWLRAAVRGDLLYVACPDAGEGNDHFIFASDYSGPAALRAAPWAKSGQVAGWAAFLADENNNDFEGWFETAGNAAQGAATGANGGVLEGVINLRNEWGIGVGTALPAAVWLAVGPYATADGGSLVSPAQVPGATVANGTLEAAEYIRVELCALTTPATCCRADFNGQSGVTVQDIYDFLSAWNGASPAADFNGADGVTVQDIYDFLSAWNTGCP